MNCAGRHVLRILPFLALLGCSHPKEGGPPAHERRSDRSIVLRESAQQYVRVEPAAAASPTAGRSLVARVSFDERHVARIGAPVQGKVAKVSVVSGDAVKPGDVLIVLNAPDIATAQAQVAQARTARDLAERTAARAAMLVKEGAGSESDRAQAESALAQARNEEQRAVAALSAVGGARGSNEYAITSPIAGTVVERNVNVGAQVHADADKPLVTVADLATVWVLADVYEQDLARIHVGDSATVALPTRTDHRFEAKVTQLASVIDPQTQSAQARLEIDNADHLLLPGMFAQVEIRGEGEGSIEIPTSALLPRRDQFFVFVKNADGSFSQREVKIGEQRGEHTIVLSGVKVGDPIVTEGAILLDAELHETR